MASSCYSRSRQISHLRGLEESCLCLAARYRVEWEAIAAVDQQEETTRIYVESGGRCPCVPGGVPCEEPCEASGRVS